MSKVVLAAFLLFIPPAFAEVPAGQNSVKAVLALTRQIQDANPGFNERLGHLMILFSRLDAEGRLELASRRREGGVGLPVEYDPRTQTVVFDDLDSFTPSLGFQALMQALQHAYDDRKRRPWEYLYEGEYRGLKAALIAVEYYGIENLRNDLKDKPAALLKFEHLYTAHKQNGNGRALLSLLYEDQGLSHLLKLEQAYERAKPLRRANKEDLRIDAETARRKLEGAAGAADAEALRVDLQKRRTDILLQKDWKGIKKEREIGDALELKTNLNY